jgi:hypothetical protein
MPDTNSRRISVKSIFAVIGRSSVITVAAAQAELPTAVVNRWDRERLWSQFRVV